MKVAIIKYNAGNVFSVYCALKRLGADVVITDEEAEIKKADKVVFPGVGDAKAAMDYLNANGLSQIIKGLKQPVLGICIGMQLLCEHSEEGDVDCLGIFNVPVKRFVSTDAALKVPEMGWNTISEMKAPLFNGISENSYVYYVHSYYAPISEYTIAKTDYIESFSAALHKDNFYATQFHPEKSGDIGERILKNFLEL